MKRLLLVLPLAGCPHHGSTGPKGGEIYAGIFEPQRQWAYAVTDDPGDGSEPSTYEVSCQVTDERDWPDGKVSMISCDGTFGEGMQEAVGGMWASDAKGLWYLPELVVDDLAETTAMPREQMIPARMILGAAPGNPCHEDPKSPERSWAKVCFADGGVTSGELGWGGNPHHVTFTEAAEEE